MRKHSRKFTKSLRWAIRGIYIAVKYETHMRVHLVAAALAIVAGLLLRVDRQDWLILCFAITLVLFAELVNTALESHVDLVTKQKKIEAMIAKDVAAGAVLITSLNAVIVGLVVFGSRLRGLFF